MSVRTGSPHMTACEAFRLINDLCQTDTFKDKTIRDLCVVGLIISKEVSKEVPADKLKEIVKNRKELEGISKRIVNRMNPQYKHNWKNRNELKEKYLGVK